MKKFLSFVVASAITASSLAFSAFAAPNRYGVETTGEVGVGLDVKLGDGITYNNYLSASNPYTINVSSAGIVSTFAAKATINMDAVAQKWNEYLNQGVKTLLDVEDEWINNEANAVAVENAKNAILTVTDLSASRFTITIESDAQVKNPNGASASLVWSPKANELFVQEYPPTYTPAADDSGKNVFTVTMMIRPGVTNATINNFFKALPRDEISLVISGNTISGIDVAREVKAQFTGNISIDVPDDNDMTVSFDETDTNYIMQHVVTGGGTVARPTTKPSPTPTVTPEVPEDIATTVEPQLQGTANGAKLNYVDHYAYIIGYDDEDGIDEVRPENPITRAEVATIFYRLLTEESRSKFRTQENNFSDVNPGDWFNNNVSTVEAAGIVNGYDDGTFGPNQKITRAEFAMIASRFTSLIHEGENLFTDISGHWAAEAINNAAITGWVNGYDDGSFDPDAHITRAEAITLINRVLYRYLRESGMHNDMVNWTDNTLDKWYYEAVQEATNSHDYDRKDIGYYETHTAVTDPYDWELHEK